MPAGIAAYSRERLIRLKPGLLINDVRINNSNFIRRVQQDGALNAPYGYLSAVR
jgi:hypothetical protein